VYNPWNVLLYDYTRLVQMFRLFYYHDALSTPHTSENKDPGYLQPNPPKHGNCLMHTIGTEAIL